MALFLSACQDSKVEKLLNQANEEWVRGRNHSAVEQFKSVLEIAPTGVYAEEALFRLGEINLYGMNDHTQAINYFKEVVQENPRGPFRYDAQKYIAEIVETNFKDYDQAIIEYQNLIDRNQVPEDNPEHQFKIATLFIKKQSYDQAVVEFELLLENYPESDWSAQAQYKIVELYYTLGKCEPARQRYQQFIKGKLKNAFKGEMDFVMASCLEEEGKLLVAYKSFKALERKYKYPAMVKMKLEGLEGRIKKSKQPKSGKSRKKKRSRRRR
jgi:TolA-binding protein